MVNRIHDFFPDQSGSDLYRKARSKQKELGARVDEFRRDSRKKREIILTAESKEQEEKLRTALARKAAEEKWAKIGLAAFLLAGASVVAKVYTGSYLGPFGQEQSSATSAPVAPQPH